MLLLDKKVMKHSSRIQHVLSIDVVAMKEETPILHGEACCILHKDNIARRRSLKLHA